MKLFLVSKTPLCGRSKWKDSKKSSNFMTYEAMTRHVGTLSNLKQGLVRCITKSKRHREPQFPTWLVVHSTLYILEIVIPRLLFLPGLPFVATSYQPIQPFTMESPLPFSALSVFKWSPQFVQPYFRSALIEALKLGPMPSHIAFIMDGNRYDAF